MIAPADAVGLSDRHTCISRAVAITARSLPPCAAACPSLPQIKEEISAKLAASKAPWKLVVGHHAVRSYGDHCGRKNAGDCTDMAFLAPLLEQHNVAVYFNGHEHDLQHIYSVSGKGSKRPDSWCIRLARCSAPYDCQSRTLSAARVAGLRGHCRYQVTGVPHGYGTWISLDQSCPACKARCQIAYKTRTIGSSW